jgi:hypothetical protein
VFSPPRMHRVGVRVIDRTMILLNLEVTRYGVVDLASILSLLEWEKVGLMVPEKLIIEVEVKRVV